MMADFKQVLQVATDGYWKRDDYPPFALAAADDRRRWNNYMNKINDELDAKDGKGGP